MSAAQPWYRRWFDRDEPGQAARRREELSELGAQRMVARLAPADIVRQLELTITRRLDGYLRGDHLGLLPGPGSELAEAREYRPGEDDVRHIDWAVTARTATPHVRDVTADRELETWALVDLTASVDFGTGMRDKRELAVNAVATLGILAGRSGDRFGGLLYTGQGVRRWPARSGRLALYGVLKTMLTAPTHTDDTKQPTLTFGDAIGLLHRAQPRRGLRLVVSDFLPPPSLTAQGVSAADAVADWQTRLRRLATQHQVLAVQVRDRREQDLPDIGVVDLVDPESGAVLEVDTSSPELREHYARAAQEQQTAIAAAIRRSGASHLVLYTDEDWVAEMVKFVHRQRHMGRRQGSAA